MDDEDEDTVGTDSTISMRRSRKKMTIEVTTRSRVEVKPSKACRIIDNSLDPFDGALR